MISIFSDNQFSLLLGCQYGCETGHHSRLLLTTQLKHITYTNRHSHISLHNIQPIRSSSSKQKSVIFSRPDFRKWVKRRLSVTGSVELCVRVCASIGLSGSQFCSHTNAAQKPPLFFVWKPPRLTPQRAPTSRVFWRGPRGGGNGR